MRRTVTACDRCSRVIPESDRAAARAYVATIAGGDLVGTSATPADLCSTCAGELVAFMANPA